MFANFKAQFLPTCSNPKKTIVFINCKKRVSYDATEIISLNSINRYVFREKGIAFFILLR
jgi:hypothetical protein